VPTNSGNSTRRIRRGHLEDAFGAGTILLLTLIAFAPLFRGQSFSMVAAHMYGQYPWVSDLKPDAEVTGRGYPQTDHAETIYPVSVFATKCVRSDQFPMWLPFSFSGIPILPIAMGTSLIYPPKLLLARRLSPIRQHDAILLSHLLLAGLGMYALLRWLGAAVYGAVFGAIVWEFNGYVTFWLTLEHSAISAAWLPLMVLCSGLAIKRRSFPWAVAAGGAIGMSMLSFINQVYAGVILVTCFYSIATLASACRLQKKGQTRSALFSLALPLSSAAVAAALSAVFWLPLLDLLSNVSRQPESLNAQLAEGVPLTGILRSTVWPMTAESIAGRALDPAALAFTGLPAIAFAAIAMTLLPTSRLRRSTPAIAAAILLAASACLAVGWRPLTMVMRWALPYAGAIHPYTWLYLFCFAIAVLSCFGLNEAISFLTRPRSTFLIGGIAVAIIAIEAGILIRTMWAINPAQPVKKEWLDPETPLIQQLRSLQGQFHVLPVRWRLASDEWTPPVLAGKTSACFELRSSSGYESLLPLSTSTFWRTVEQGGKPTIEIPSPYRPDFFQDRLPLKLLENASVGLLAVPPGVKPMDANGSDPTTDGRLSLVFSGADGWIYRITRALPRAFMVERVTVAADPDEALELVARESFEAKNSAVVIGNQTALETGLTSDSPVDASVEGTASIARDAPNAVTIETTASSAAMLVLNDSWDRGWRADIDGVKQPILRVNYAFRGVVVPPGQHRVNFVYRPPLLLIGFALSSMTLVFLSAMSIVSGVRAVQVRGRRSLRHSVAGASSS
jgi:membrane protein YfhO